MQGRARIAITGLGVVSPLGNDARALHSALVAGKSGVGPLDLFPIDKLRTDCAAIVRELDTKGALEEKERELHGRVTQFLAVAAHQAIAQANLPAESKERVGVLLGTGQGPVEILEGNVHRVIERGVRSVSPFFIPTAMPNAASALVSIRNGFRGPSFTIASACATGTNAMAIGGLLIAAGEADAMVVGGGEAAMFPNCVAGFGNARALAKSYQGDPTRASRPWDKHRSGFVIGEGAGALVLESEAHAKARGATVLAWLDGWGQSSDAEHVARPHPEGRGLALAIEAALRRAGISAGDLGYINPHATSTQAGDIAEYNALVAALGAHAKSIPISATKSMIGHLLGGAGAVESIATVMALREGTIHPSKNLEDKEEIFELDIVTTARPLSKGVALKTSAGFGGHNCALIFSKA